MLFLLSFLEGVITFVSPCLLPMLPIYIMYFSGSQPGKNSALANSLGFVLGFTAVFVTLGAFAGSVGALLQKYQTVVNIVSGTIVIIFGLNFLGVIRIGFLNMTKRLESGRTPSGFFSALLFGVVFAIGWSPCVGAFLGSALMMASQQGSTLQGMLMLLVYSLGLGIPYMLSALLIDSLKGAFDWIKRHYKLINTVCGGLLILVGILMATGVMSAYIARLAR